MIKIECGNVNRIANDYFASIKDTIINSSNFYKLVFNVLNRTATWNDLTVYRLNGNTKKALINKLMPLRNRIENQDSYDTVVTANVHAWVISEIAILNSVVDYLSDESKLQEMILCPPQGLHELSHRLMEDLQVNLSLNKSSIVGLLNAILDYSKLNEVSYWLCAQIGIQTCPYCNRIPVHTVYDNATGIIRATLDHFYPQSFHPFLALSFYNLIPACYYCNSNLKLDIEVTPDEYLHPYVDGFANDVKFGVFIASNKPNKSDPENYRIYFRKSVTLSDIKNRRIFGYVDAEGNEVKGNINLFKLLQIYQSHRDWVGEIIIKCDKYSTSQANSLTKFYELLGTNKSEFYQFYFANYYNDVDFHKRPLAKLTRDIVSQELPLF